MANNIELSLEEGSQIAHQFLKAVRCEEKSATVAGSIRRLRPTVHDIDIVFRSDARLALGVSYQKEIVGACLVTKWGPKSAAIIYQHVPIDLYFSTPETFHTLLLIRTGSKENNIRLCSIAKGEGWKLHASGDGLFNESGERIAGDSERSIYTALGVPWQEPWERG